MRKNFPVSNADTQTRVLGLWAVGAAARNHFRAENLNVLRYTHIIPIFWGQTDPTQRDLKSPIS